MNKSKGALELQRERFIKVAKWIKDTQGIKGKDLADKLDIEYTKLSQLKNGTVKYIPDDVKEKLRQNFFINPLYISGESDIMFDYFEKKFNNLEAFVDDWVTLPRYDEYSEESEKQFLYFQMDINFYDFLLSYSKAKLLNQEEGIITDRKDFQQSFEGNPEKGVYAVIPIEKYNELVEKNRKRRKETKENFVKITELLNESMEMEKEIAASLFNETYVERKPQIKIKKNNPLKD